MQRTMVIRNLVKTYNRIIHSPELLMISDTYEKNELVEDNLNAFTFIQILTFYW